MRRQNNAFSMTLLRHFALLTVVQLLVLGIQSQSNSCHTPRNQPGTCINLKKCGPLIELLKQRPIPASDLEYLRESSCGFEGSDPKVCCPSGGLNSNSGSSNNRPSQNENVVSERPRPIPTRAPQIESNNNIVNSNLLPDTSICGVSADMRIYGGEATNLDEFPWMALLEYQKPVGRGFYCGGVLISKRYVMTAAHCVKGKDIPRTWSLVSVRLGEYNTETDVDCVDNGFGGQECSEDPINVPIEEQIAHEQYDPNNSNQYHDIALLRLVRDVTFSEFIKPICLPYAGYNINSLFVAGWGKTESRSESNVKLKVQVPLIDKNQCSPIYQRASVNLGAGQLCAGGQKGKDSCRGDSGGPLMTVTSQKASGTANWYAVGVVSFGPSPCGMQGWPGVYTKVADYVPWIVSKLRP